MDNGLGHLMELCERMVLYDSLAEILNGLNVDLKQELIFICRVVQLSYTLIYKSVRISSYLS